MRIIYFHQHYSTPHGSAGTRSYEMARALVARGHQVTMVCGSYHGGQTGLTQNFKAGVRRGLCDGIDVIEFELPYSNRENFLNRSRIFLTFAIRSIGLAMGEKYDIAFATTTPLTAGIPGLVARWLRQKPFVFEVRDLWPELPRAMGAIRNPIVLFAMSVLEWISYHSAHHLVGLSPGIVDGIAKLGISRNRITLIPNGCDLDIFGNDPTPWRPAGVEAADLMAVFTGTHGSANGLRSVLAAAQELKARQRRDIKIVLIGNGAEKPSLLAKARSDELENVVFLDPVGKTKLAGLNAGADLGLQLLANVPAFYYGTSPNKFFDYISAGLPVLNNYPGWLSEMIIQNGCGFAVPPDDPSAFADALEAAADDRAMLKAMGARSRALAQREFDRRKLSAEFVEVLENVAKMEASH